MKKKCPDCDTTFDVNTGEIDEGDPINCPECNLEFTVVGTSSGSLRLIESKKLEMEELEEAELGKDEDYDFD